MDPISAAIIGALIAGATKVSERALNDAYSGLKTLIERRFGSTSELVQAVDAVERDPNSEPLQQWLQQAVTQTGAEGDAQIRQAAEILIQQIQRRPHGQQIISNVRDSVVVGGDYVGRDQVGGDYIGRDYVNIAAEPSMYIPETTVGWIITIPGLICTILGFLIFFFNLISTFNTGPRPGGGFPEGIGLGFGLAAVGVLVLFVGGVIDRALSRRSKP
jgi:hypothetical protein